jgi:hypothetical protein
MKSSEADRKPDVFSPLQTLPSKNARMVGQNGLAIGEGKRKS